MTRTRLIATTKDVARLAGVSPATVSYVINQNNEGTPNITPATQSRVLAAMAQLNYVPNMAGRNLRRQLTERICLALTDIGRPYDNKLVQDIQNVADQHNHSLIITTIDTPERKTKVLKQLQSRLADGAIINHEDVEEAELQILVKAQISLVVFSNRLTPAGFDVVWTNEGESSYKAVNYLLEKGHRRIGIITNFYKNPTHDARLNSYQQALTDFGLPLDDSLIVTGTDRSEAYLGAKKLLQLPDRPTAIFAASDRAAISAIWTVYDAGLRIPEDIAIIGVGNIPESQYTSPALTTIGPVSLDFTEAANLLFSRMQDPSLIGRKHLINWELIRRGSA
jgi:DNA-binding LacI/PurR family transcriptional regulator